MNLTATSVVLIGLTLIGAAASVRAVARLRRAAREDGGRRADDGSGDAATAAAPDRMHNRAVHLAVALIGIVCLLLLAGRWRRLPTWSPVSSHLDGLLLIAVLLAAVALFLQTRPRMAGLAAFTLPVLTFILLWAICAATWTDRRFLVSELHPVWRAIHLVGVYLGTGGSAVAAIAAGDYLFVEHRLKTKRDPRGLLRLASLERLERLIVHAATLGFALLSVGLVSGLVIILEEGTVLGPGWWYSPKVLLAFVAWLIFALVMNVRFATVFRGRRAAWLAIAGFVVLLGVYALVTAGNGENQHVFSGGRQPPGVSAQRPCHPCHGGVRPPPNNQSLLRLGRAA